MVEAGEQGGMLVEVLRRLAEYCEQEFELQLTIKRKTLYPKILLGAFFVIPQIPVLVLAGVGPFLAAVWAQLRVVALFVIPTFLAFRFALTTPGFRNFYDQVKLLIPFVGGLVRKLAIARFARTLAALYSSGVPIASATGLAGETSGNHVLERHSERMVPAIERGMPLSQTMLASGFFPGMFVGMVQTGETSGNLDDILNKAADFYEEEALHATIQLTVILGVVLLLVMGVLIAIRIIGFYTGYFQGVFGGAGGGE
jgi:type IV pilus assembly protein PilC